MHFISIVILSNQLSNHNPYIISWSTVSSKSGEQHLVAFLFFIFVVFSASPHNKLFVSWGFWRIRFSAQIFREFMQREKQCNKMKTLSNLMRTTCEEQSNWFLTILSDTKLKHQTVLTITNKCEIKTFELKRKTHSKTKIPGGGYSPE